MGVVLISKRELNWANAPYDIMRIGDVEMKRLRSPPWAETPPIIAGLRHVPVAALQSRYIR
jgi:hypothetical protein